MAKIIIIEDDEHVALSLKLGLEGMQHEVMLAENGRKGLALLQDFAAELIITDIVMPEMEGLETITKITVSYPDIPIIAISGGGRSSSQDYLKMADLMGASRVFSKPMDLDALRDAIKELVSEKAE